MTIAFIAEKYEGVVNALRTTLDSYDVVGGNNLRNFLTTSRERNEFFDRIILVDKVLTPSQEVEDLRFLKTYVETVSPNLEIILTVQRDSGSPLPELFLSEFSAPMYTVALLPKQTTSKIIQDLVTLPVLDLKARYYEIDRRNLGSTGSTSGSPTSNGSSTKSSVSTKPKKRGFFASLFGGRKEEEEEIDTDISSEDVPTPPTVVAPPTVVSPPVVGAVDDDLFAPPVGGVAPSVSESPLSALFKPSSPAVEGEEFVGSSSPEVSDGFVSVTQGNEQVTGGYFSSSETEGDDDLNFGNFGDLHAQTGYIDEEDVLGESTDVELGGSVSQPFLEGVSLGGSGFQPVTSDVIAEDVGSGLASDGVYEPSNLMSTLDTPQLELSTVVSNTVSVGDVVVFTGTGSTSSVASYLKLYQGVAPILVVDLLGDLGMLRYLNSSRYYASEDAVYEEGGISYLISSLDTLSDLPNLSIFASKYVLVVNTPISGLSVLNGLIGALNSIEVISVFSSNLHEFEGQLLEFEGVSPEISRLISLNSKAIIDDNGNIQGITSYPGLEKVVVSSVFSRVNWKGVFDRV